MSLNCLMHQSIDHHHPLPPTSGRAVDRQAIEQFVYFDIVATVAGGGLLPIYDIVRMCGANSPLFQRCQVYGKAPFSKKKYMTGQVFHHCYMNGLIF